MASVAGKLRNHGLVPGRGMRLFSYARCPDWVLRSTQPTEWVFSGSFFECKEAWGWRWPPSSTYQWG